MSNVLRYLIDTDWSIDYMHQRRSTIRLVDEFAPQGIGLSIISVAELYEGAFYSTDTHAEIQSLQYFLSGFEIVHLDEDICRIFAQQRGRLRTSGNLIGDLDILIGATAIRHNLTLLTNNIRHFNRLVGLNIISA